MVVQIKNFCQMFCHLSFWLALYVCVSFTTRRQANSWIHWAFPLERACVVVKAAGEGVTLTIYSFLWHEPAQEINSLFCNCERELERERERERESERERERERKKKREKEYVQFPLRLLVLMEKSDPFNTFFLVKELHRRDVLFADLSVYLNANHRCIFLYV